jgi:predicted MFS family arabinose efflux permease
VFVSFQLANAWGWRNVSVWAVLIGSLVAIVIWGWHQSRQADPLINVHSLGRRPILLANLSISLLAMGCMQNGQVMSLLLQQPLWTQVGFGLSAGAAGTLLLPLMAITLIGSPWGGSLAGRQGARSVALIGYLLVAAGWIAIALYHQSLSFVVAADVVALFGLSFVQPAAYLTVVDATPADHTSEATGMTFVFVNIFMSIGGQAVFLLLATSTVKSATAAGTYPGPATYLLVFIYVIATALAGLLAAWLLPKAGATARAAA